MDRVPVRSWLILAAATVAQAGVAVLSNGAAFLIPELTGSGGLTLPQAGVVVAMPLVGIMLTLVAWGAAADRFGERYVLIIGAAIAAACAWAGSRSSGPVELGVWLLIAGAAAASANAASGRAVVGWFPQRRRGLAMGIRQMAIPAGVAIAAATMPGIADAHGANAALLVPAAVSGIGALACLWIVVDPPRPQRDAAAPAQTRNPYRGSRHLVRIHAASILLVVPQYAIWTFSLVWLIDAHGVDPVTAGAVITVTQIVGALGRVAVGMWSDRVGSHLRPMRTIAAVIAVAMVLLSIPFTDAIGWTVFVVALAGVATVLPNGPAFAEVAETAGPFWGGRALGIQNTGQFVAAAAVPPVLGWVITAAGYPIAFVGCAALAAAARTVIPARRPGTATPPAPAGHPAATGAERANQPEPAAGTGPGNDSGGGSTGTTP